MGYYEYRSGYRAGSLVSTVAGVLKALGWDNWGEPNSDWQRGFLAGYEARRKHGPETAHGGLEDHRRNSQGE